MKGTLTLEFRENKEAPRKTEFDIVFDIEEFDPVVFATALSEAAEQASDKPESIEVLLFWAMMLSRKRHKNADEPAAENKEESPDE